MIGIYKITSPNGKIYIGQSIEIEKRFNYYKLLCGKGQIRLHRSLIKHGVENHNFQIIEECEINILNDRERYYQDLYDVIGKNGLNCRLTVSTDKSGKLSEETKLKIKLGHNRYPMSEKHKLIMSKIHKGKIVSEETKKKQSVSAKNRSVSINARKRCMKKVIDTSTNIIYESAVEVSKQFNINCGTLYNYLKNNRKNKTTFRYV